MTFSITYCIKCGGMNHNLKGTFTRFRCTRCDYITYCNPLPGVAIIVRRTRDEKIVICRRKSSGLWCLPCGFIECDETYQEAAKREVFEESGLIIDVECILNVYSNIYTASESTLVIALLAQTKDETVLHAGDDVDDVCWVSRDELSRFSFAYEADWEIIDNYYSGYVSERGKILTTINKRYGRFK